MISSRLINKTKPTVLILLILPSLIWIGMFISGSLGVNPIDILMDKLGEMALRLLILVLIVSSLSQFHFLRSLQNLRRLLGLVAFYYIFLHLSCYVFLDHFFNFTFIVKDVIKRPFITFGFIPSPNTMFENLFSVNPGSLVEFSLVHEKIIVERSLYYWKPTISNEINDLDNAVELITDSINNSMEEGMDASIDVACLFSGGVDSSVIFSNARNINEDIWAITADFGQHDDADSRSRSLAEKLGLRKH